MAKRQVPPPWHAAPQRSVNTPRQTGTIQAWEEPNECCCICGVTGSSANLQPCSRCKINLFCEKAECRRVMHKRNHPKHNCRPQRESHGFGGTASRGLTPAEVSGEWRCHPQLYTQARDERIPCLSQPRTLQSDLPHLAQAPRPPPRLPKTLPTAEV